MAGDNPQTEPERRRPPVQHPRAQRTVLVAVGVAKRVEHVP